MGLNYTPQDPQQNDRPKSLEEFLAAEQPRIAAEEAMLNSPDSAVPPEATKAPPPYRYEETMPPEVFAELQRRFNALPKGAERNRGIVTQDIDGKHYGYDAYAGQEARGYPRVRDAGPVANFFQRFGQEFSGQREVNQRNYQTAAARKLQIRNMDADEVYRQAMMEQQGRQFSQAHAERHSEALLGIRSRAFDRATNAWYRTQPKPAAERDAAQEARDTGAANLANAQAGLARRQTQLIGAGFDKNGKPIKPDYTPEEAWKNLREADANVAGIQDEINQIDKQAPGPNFLERHHVPGEDTFTDWTGLSPSRGLAALTGTGTEGVQGDVTIKNPAGKKIKTIPAAQVTQYRIDRQRQLDFYREQRATFHGIAKNGNIAPKHPGTGDPSLEEETEGTDVPDPDDPGGWDAASKIPAGSQVQPTSAAPPAAVSGVRGRRPTPPPDVLAKLPYRDQLYHQIAAMYPQAPDQEILRMVLQVMSGQTPPGTTVERRPAPGRER